MKTPNDTDNATSLDDLIDADIERVDTDELQGTMIRVDDPEEFYAYLLAKYKEAVTKGQEFVHIKGNAMPIEAVEGVIEGLNEMLNGEEWAQHKKERDLEDAQRTDRPARH